MSSSCWYRLVISASYCPFSPSDSGAGGGAKGSTRAASPLPFLLLLLSCWSRGTASPAQVSQPRLQLAADSCCPPVPPGCPWRRGPPAELASPFLQRFNSFSSFWIMTLRLRLLSFSFSYFFFHSSAVSSWLTDTVFLMVLALEPSKHNTHLCLGPSLKALRLHPGRGAQELKLGPGQDKVSRLSPTSVQTSGWTWSPPRCRQTANNR